MALATDALNESLCALSLAEPMSDSTHSDSFSASVAKAMAMEDESSQ